MVNLWLRLHVVILAKLKKYGGFASWVTKIRLGGGLGSSDSNLHAALPLQK